MASTDEELSDEVRIRRHMSLAKLVSLLTTESLYFASLASMEDPYEGALPAHLLKNPVIASWQQAIQAETFISCWHEETVESDSLWRIYALEEGGVAVRTTVGALRSALPTEMLIDGQVHSLSPHRVLYVDPHGFSRPDPHPALYKRHYFQAEQEIRAVLWPHFTEGVKGRLPHGGAMTGSDTSGEHGEEAQPAEIAGRPVPASLEVLIEQVVVSPYAKQWVFDAVAALLERFGLAGRIEYSKMRPSTG